MEFAKAYEGKHKNGCWCSSIHTYPERICTTPIDLIQIFWRASTCPRTCHTRHTRKSISLLLALHTIASLAAVTQYRRMRIGMEFPMRHLIQFGAMSTRMYTAPTHSDDTRFFLRRKNSIKCRHQQKQRVIEKCLPNEQDVKEHVFLDSTARRGYANSSSSSSSHQVFPFCSPSSTHFAPLVDPFLSTHRPSNPTMSMPNVIANQSKSHHQNVPFIAKFQQADTPANAAASKTFRIARR